MAVTSQASGSETVTPAATRRGIVAFAALALVLVIAAPLWWMGVGRKPPTPLVDAIAVLPFENLSLDAEQEYFSDGMTELLITDLSKVGALRVISSGSVMQYKSRPKPIAEIARELSVNALVQGSVLRAGDRVRITVELINPADGRLLWSERYERELRDVLALQNDIAVAVVSSVRASIAPAEQQQLRRASAIDPRAQEAYLLGRYHTVKKTPDSLKDRKSVV